MRDGSTAAAFFALGLPLRFQFKTNKLRALYTDEKDAHKYPPGVVEAFFEVMTSVRNADDIRDVRMLKGLRYEKLAGKRKEQRSLRLNDQFRLIVQEENDDEGMYLLIIDIVDYH